MTGRRLYDLLCDGWATQGEWARERGKLMRSTPVAWPFLSQAERRTFSAAAARIKPTRRAAK